MMIFHFFDFLEDNQVSYCMINGYTKLFDALDEDSDIDILFQLKSFNVIENLIEKFCVQYDYKILQVIHHDVRAKYFVIYDIEKKNFLKLDLYGELSRKGVLFFHEKEIFTSLNKYKDIPILSHEKEFIYYLVKRIGKNDIRKAHFQYLQNLYNNCEFINDLLLKKYFKNYYRLIDDAFKNSNIDIIRNNQSDILFDFNVNKKFDIHRILLNSVRLIQRIKTPTGLVISFVSSDDNFKSKIRDQLFSLACPAFLNKQYFSLRQSSQAKIVKKTFDVEKPVLSKKIKLYVKTLFSIFINKRKSSLIIFERPLNDFFLLKSDLYLILTEDLNNLEVTDYNMHSNQYQYVINVNQSIENLTAEIRNIIMEIMYERY